MRGKFANKLQFDGKKKQLPSRPCPRHNITISESV